MVGVKIKWICHLMKTHRERDGANAPALAARPCRLDQLSRTVVSVMEAPVCWSRDNRDLSGTATCWDHHWHD